MIKPIFTGLCALVAAIAMSGPNEKPADTCSVQLKYELFNLDYRGATKSAIEAAQALPCGVKEYLDRSGFKIVLAKREKDLPEPYRSAFAQKKKAINHGGTYLDGIAHTVTDHDKQELAAVVIMGRHIKYNETRMLLHETGHSLNRLAGGSFTEALYSSNRFFMGPCDAMMRASRNDPTATCNYELLNGQIVHDELFADTFAGLHHKCDTSAMIERPSPGMYQAMAQLEKSIEDKMDEKNVKPVMADR